MYRSLADITGQLSNRSVVSMRWGVGEINRKTQPIQDRILEASQLDKVLGGSDADCMASSKSLSPNEMRMY